YRLSSMPYSASAFGVLPPLWSSAAKNPRPERIFSSCMASMPAILAAPERSVRGGGPALLGAGLPELHYTEGDRLAVEPRAASGVLRADLPVALDDDHTALAADVLGGDAGARGQRADGHVQALADQIRHRLALRHGGGRLGPPVGGRAPLVQFDHAEVEPAAAADPGTSRRPLEADLPVTVKNLMARPPGRIVAREVVKALGLRVILRGLQPLPDEI